VTSRTSATGAASLSRDLNPSRLIGPTLTLNESIALKGPAKSIYPSTGDAQIMILMIFITDSAQHVCENALKLLSARTCAVRARDG
jgi:hypothetical protein